MAAMPLLNRLPEAPLVRGLLILLALILLVTALRYFPYFVREVLGMR